MGTIIAILAGILGGIWAAYQLGQKINASMRRQDKIDQLLQRELGDDGNGSLKSQVNKTHGQMSLMGDKLELVKKELRFLQYTLDSHVSDLSVHAHDPRAHHQDDGTLDDGPAGPPREDDR